MAWSERQARGGCPGHLWSCRHCTACGGDGVGGKVEEQIMAGAAVPL